MHEKKREGQQDGTYAKYIAPRWQDQSVRLKEVDTFGHTISKKHCHKRNADSGDAMVNSCGPWFVYCKAKDNAIIYEERFPCTVTSGAYTSDGIQRVTKAGRFKKRAHVLSYVIHSCSMCRNAEKIKWLPTSYNRCPCRSQWRLTDRRRRLSPRIIATISSVRMPLNLSKDSRRYSPRL